MAKIIILFASMSGNTEEMAEIIEENVTSCGHSVTKYHIDMDEVQPKELLSYDGILLGTYTWGDGDIPYEFEEFYDDLEEIDLTGKTAGVFGSCDSMYPIYGGAIDTFGERFQSCGARLVLENLKVELTPEEQDVKRCREFAVAFASQLST
ncbi:flavodoxin [Alteribacillus sp. HJP-4]|uniref:flavodoxin n=1 Tax=Alteribacillus sp. HJP-4 TaxID=2775394 RepID=UPI0035CCDB27